MTNPHRDDPFPDFGAADAFDEGWAARARVTDTMVEAAAIAMWCVDHKRERWDEKDEDFKDIWRNEARVAITAALTTR